MYSLVPSFIKELVQIAEFKAYYAFQRKLTKLSDVHFTIKSKNLDAPTDPCQLVNFPIHCFNLLSQLRSPKQTTTTPISAYFS